MKYEFRIGNIGFRFITPIELKIEKTIRPFICPIEGQPDVTVKIDTDYERASEYQMEETSGEDLLLKYYPWRQGVLCVAKGGWRGNLSVSVCDQEFQNITCYLNTEIFSKAACSIGNVLRLLPVRMIFQHHGVLFFHASQIAVGGVGVLFSAPSGTGKTTQAKLWKKYRNAEMICNDRTLVRKGKTYGYPIDGSEPVISEKVHSLGAIVLLSQSSENSVIRLRPGKALTGLMPQLVFDTWSGREKEQAAELLIGLLEKYPVYLLNCTPDEAAVCCLENQLREDGVLK